MLETPDIPGAEKIVAWFGYWPSFHDAEVLSLTLNREGESSVVIQAFEMTAEITPDGHYVLAKHCRVTFFWQGFLCDESGTPKLELACFNHQNVLSGAEVKKVEGGYELILEGCYGLDGVISAERLRVEIAPAHPD